MIKSFAEFALETLLKCGADWAEIYYEENYYANLLLHNRNVSKNQMGVECGMGIRVWKNDHEEYASTNQVTLAGLAELLETVCAGLRTPQQPGKLQLSVPAEGAARDYDFQTEKPVEILHYLLPELTESCGLTSLSGEFNSSFQRIRVFNSLGEYATDERLDQSLMILGVKKLEDRSITINRPVGRVEDFVADYKKSLSELTAAVRDEISFARHAVPVRGGEWPVVIARGQGVFVHEIIGHSLEADNVMNQSSIFTGKLLEQVANENVTIVDECVPGQKGYYQYDDEGVPANKTVLVKDGHLNQLLTDRKTAAKLGLPLTGNGRRESYLYPPVPRMSCTYMENGLADADDLISEVREGLYVAKLLGGEVDTSTGEFYLNAPRLYKIHHGKLGEFVADAILTGNILKVLKNIVGVANDLTLDQTGKGLCYKFQSVPVSFGQPTILINELKVRG